MPRGSNAWHRRRRGFARSPGCRFHRTMAPARSDGASTICRPPGARRTQANCWRRRWLATWRCTWAAGHGRARRAPMRPMPDAPSYSIRSNSIGPSELLDLFEIERAWLPVCTSTRGDWGRLRLPDHEVQLRAVTGDQSAVPYATGEPDPGRGVRESGHRRVHPTTAPIPSALPGAAAWQRAEPRWRCGDLFPRGHGQWRRQRRELVLRTGALQRRGVVARPGSAPRRCRAARLSERHRWAGFAMVAGGSGLALRRQRELLREICALRCRRPRCCASRH